MAEMGRISRFFVNRFNARRSARVFGVIRDRAAVPAQASWLEVGCGNGDLASRIVDGLQPAKYVGTDLDPHQLDAARDHLAERYPSGLPPALEFREADMLHLPFADGSFDAVVAIVSIHHASPNHHDPVNVPPALAEIDRVLRPGGVLVYEEFLHKDVIRAWLAEHGYAASVVDRGVKRESVVAGKPEGSSRVTTHP